MSIRELNVPAYLRSWYVVKGDYQVIISNNKFHYGKPFLWTRLSDEEAKIKLNNHIGYYYCES